MFYLSTLSGNTYISGINSSQQLITANVGDEITLPKLTVPSTIGYDFLGWVNGTTGEKYMIADYSDLAEYKFTYQGNALVMYALWA